MAFTVTYFDDRKETVDADSYTDQGDWIDFRKRLPQGETQQVLRVRAGEVSRIEKSDS